MPSGRNILKNVDDRFLIIKSFIEKSNKDYEKTQKLHESELTNIKTIIENIIIKIDNISPYRVESTKYQYSDTVVPANNKLSTTIG